MKSNKKSDLALKKIEALRLRHAKAVEAGNYRRAYKIIVQKELALEEYHTAKDLETKKKITLVKPPSPYTYLDCIGGDKGKISSPIIKP